jgi:C1A family cysteine protease
MPRYGALRDQQDIRDLHLATLGLHIPILPPMIDYRPSAPPIVDQGNLGSCTANAIPHGAVLAHALKGTSVAEYPRSRLWLYWNERWMEHAVKQDVGAMPRDGLRILRKVGVPDEQDWPYDVTKFAVHPPELLQDAANCKIGSFYRCHGMLELKQALVAKHPVVMGFSVPQSFEGPDVAQTGVMPMPAPDEPTVGGHCVCVDGYDDAQGALIIANSWSTGWGDQGYFYMPYDFVNPKLGYVWDLWAVVV